MAADPNPYAPPSVACHRDVATLPVLPESRWNEVTVRAFVTRGWWKRYVSLFGTTNAELMYDPIGVGERLYLDGRLIVTTPPAHQGRLIELVQPRVDFFLEALGHAVPARIDVKASIFFFKTYAFRLTVAGKTVYDET